MWITGASSGIGEELAYRLSTAGAHLVLSARNEKDLEAVAESCRGQCLYPLSVIKFGVMI